MKKQGVCVEAAPAPKVAEVPTSEPEPMEVDDVVAQVEAVKPVVEEVKAPAAAPNPAPVAATPTKKKKKKTSYKNLMAGMMKSSPTRDVEQEKEQLRKVTGGGTFSKIDKI